MKYLHTQALWLGVRHRRRIDRKLKQLARAEAARRGVKPPQFSRRRRLFGHLSRKDRS